MAEESNPRSVTETLNGSYMFTIQDYSVAAKGIGVGKHITSDEFTAGGHKWAIYFYPNGKDRSTHVFLCVVLKSEATDVRAHLELTLMDLSGEGNHRRYWRFKRDRTHAFSQCGSFWGFQRFLRVSGLETSDYLRDGCLKIYITIGVVSDCGIWSHIGMRRMEGTDITLNVSGEKFHAHKSMLASFSPKIWSESLRGVGKGEELMVQDIEPDVFKALLHFLYKGALAESELITSASSSAYVAEGSNLAHASCFVREMGSGRSCSVREMGSGSNLFVVEGYSMAKDIGVGNYIVSDEFMMGGCKWILYLYPNGKTNWNSAFLSLLPVLKSEAGDIPGTFEFTLMDLSGNGNHLVRQYTVNSICRTGGFTPRWIRRAGLETSDFLRDDCLKIYCNLTVTGSNLRRRIENINFYSQIAKSLHEEIFNGDFDPENWDDLAPKIPAPPEEIMQDDADEDEAGGEGELSKLEKELRKLLLSPSSRLSGSDADDKDNDGDMEVDTYSVVVPKKEASNQEPVDNSPLKATSSAAGCGTPSVSKSSKLKREHSGQGSKALNNAPLKKARQENELKRVKDETASSSKSGATPPAGPVTEDEIKDAFLLMGTHVSTTKMVIRFNSRLKLKEEKDAFAATLKRIAKIEKVGSRYYLVRREMI